MPNVRSYIPPYLRDARIQRRILRDLDEERSHDGGQQWWFRFPHPRGNYGTQAATIIPYAAFLSVRYPELLDATDGPRRIETVAWGVNRVLNARGHWLRRPR